MRRRTVGLISLLLGMIIGITIYDFTSRRHYEKRIEELTNFAIQCQKSSDINSAVFSYSMLPKVEQDKITLAEHIEKYLKAEEENRKNHE